jgi:hypothetical protein
MPENEWNIAEYVIAYYPFGGPLSTPADRRRLSEGHALLRLDDWVRFHEHALLEMYWKMGDRLGFPPHSPPKSFEQIRKRLAEAIGDGSLVVYARPFPTFRRSAPPIPPPALTAVAPFPSKVQDWRIECAHHAEKSERHVIERGTYIAVVPSMGETKDVVNFYVRDDENGMRQSLNTGSVNVPMVGKSASNYAVYKLDAEYKGNVSDHRFPLPTYWAALSDVTKYRVSGAPSTIEVDVYNPRQHKIELKVPPFRKYTTGSKLTNFDVKLDVKEKELVHCEKSVRWDSKKTARWSPSKLKLTTTRAATRAGDAKPAEESEETQNKALVDSVAFWVDGNAVELDGAKVSPPSGTGRSTPITGSSGTSTSTPRWSSSGSTWRWGSVSRASCSEPRPTSSSAATCRSKEA